MKCAVVVFPGSNCDRDMAVALSSHCGPTEMVWHKEPTLPDGLDLVAIPGGFSFGDYLRCGAIAARAPVMGAVVEFARRGGLVLGVCNGFQVLCEVGLLPGALMRNAALKFVCRSVHLRVETTASPFTHAYGSQGIARLHVAHHDGCYIAGDDVAAQLEAEDRIAFRYVDPDGQATEAANPNGSRDNIAGILSENRRVLGLMPHPERVADPVLGGSDGKPLFRSLTDALAHA